MVRCLLPLLLVCPAFAQDSGFTPHMTFFVERHATFLGGRVASPSQWAPWWFYAGDPVFHSAFGWQNTTYHGHVALERVDRRKWVGEVRAGSGWSVQTFADGSMPLHVAAQHRSFPVTLQLTKTGSVCTVNGVNVPSGTYRRLSNGGGEFSFSMHPADGDAAYLGSPFYANRGSDYGALHFTFTVETGHAEDFPEDEDEGDLGEGGGSDPSSSRPSTLPAPRASSWLDDLAAVVTEGSQGIVGTVRDRMEYGQIGSPFGAVNLPNAPGGPAEACAAFKAMVNFFYHPGPGSGAPDWLQSRWSDKRDVLCEAMASFHETMAAYEDICRLGRFFVDVGCCYASYRYTMRKVAWGLGWDQPEAAEPPL